MSFSTSTKNTDNDGGGKATTSSNNNTNNVCRVPRMDRLVDAQMRTHLTSLSYPSRITIVIMISLVLLLCQETMAFQQATTSISASSKTNHNSLQQRIDLPLSTKLFQTDSRSAAADEEAEARAKRAQKVKEDALNYPPIILDPFPEAADPKYAVRGTIGQGDFVISRDGGPTLEELSNENLYRILVRRSNVTDLEVNTLVWKCLGYRFDSTTEEWTATEVFPKWKERFPTPPDLIGMQRIYSKDVDGPSLKNNQHLVRSIPADNKQSLKEQLKPLGFTGYKVSELTPNLTRRAQCSNWLLYYREELFGRSLEELQERRKQKKEAEEQARKESGEQAKWTPPVKEVF